jgi:hypothetical protein
MGDFVGKAMIVGHQAFSRRVKSPSGDWFSAASLININDSAAKYCRNPGGATCVALRMWTVNAGM